MTSPLPLDHDIITVLTVCFSPAPTFVKRFGVSLLVSAMRRIKQLIEVEILQNLPCLLLILLSVVLNVGGLATPLPLVRTNAITNETVLVARALKLCVLDQVL